MANPIHRSVLQCIDDSRQVVHYLLVDPSITTAQTILSPDDMPTPELREIWSELVAMDDAMMQRSISTLARRLRRRGVEPGRELRCVVATDTSIPRLHLDRCCTEIRRHREQSEQLVGFFEIGPTNLSYRRGTRSHLFEKRPYQQPGASKEFEGIIDEREFNPRDTRPPEPPGCRDCASCGRFRDFAAWKEKAKAEQILTNANEQARYNTKAGCSSAGNTQATLTTSP